MEFTLEKHGVSKKECDLLLLKTRQLLTRVRGITVAQQVTDKFLNIEDLDIRYTAMAKFLRGIIKSIEGDTDPFGDLYDMSHYKFKPVDAVTFLTDPYYLGKKDEVYPTLLPLFAEMNNGDYDELVLTGAIGTAKTTLALWSNLYQLYLLSCLKNPQRTFGISKADEILIVFQSISENLAKDLDYARFKASVDDSPYFAENFMYDRAMSAQLKFPNRIIVKPVSGQDTAAIGQNVIGGIIDEVNYMAVVEKSKQTDDGSTYDQATALYNSIARRRESRFMSKGSLAGLLCLVSSRKYPNQFTDKKEMEAKTNPRIYIYDKRVWDIKPDKFLGEWFWVFAGDSTRKPKILETQEDLAYAKSLTEMDVDFKLYIEIPIEYKQQFEKDMTNALREIAGLATLATSPFILHTDHLKNVFSKAERSFFRERIVNFDDKALHLIAENISKCNKSAKRYVHLDLSETGDRTGFAIGHVRKFVQMHRGDSVEVLPDIKIDGTLGIEAPQGGEILYYKIRSLIYKLTELGVPIKWISFDTYQSTDSRQMLGQRGYQTGVLSMDTSMLPYTVTKSAIYDGRLHAPFCEMAMMEFARLEHDTKKNKVDHPAGFSKDIADAVAGVVHGLTNRREIWIDHGVDPDNASQITQESMAKHEDKVKRRSYTELGLEYD